MIAAVPLIGNILAGIAASVSGVASPTQEDQQKIKQLGSATSSSNFTQTMDKLDRASGSTPAQHTSAAKI